MRSLRVAGLLIGFAALAALRGGAWGQGMPKGESATNPQRASSTAAASSSTAGASMPSTAATSSPSTAGAGSTAGSSSAAPLTGTTQTGAPGPSGIPISTTATRTLSNVQLVYVVGYGAETAVPMTGSGGSYSATVPAATYKPGSLVRWAVTARDGSGATVRDPPLDPQGPKYYGAIIPDPADQASLPVIELYCPDPKAPFGKNETKGCSLQVAGRFYDNVGVRRRGSTSLGWPKPKVRVDAPKNGPRFVVKEGLLPLDDFNLNSEWYEQGENSFMRETLTWEYLRQAGAESLPGFQAHVRLNGAYYGKFALGTSWDKQALKASGFNADPIGPLWKAMNGQYSNLRWDLPADQIQWNWQKESRRNDSDDWLLQAFTRGIAGGGPLPRSKYIFDAVNLPQVINHMAAQTLINNNDRCTKNFYVYYDLSSQQWSMLAWDVESGFGSDRGLNGQPAPDYCILECEQWNSPLYCDRSHPQDLAINTPWSIITSSYDLGPSGRRLLQAGPQQSAGYEEEDLTKQGATKTGASGTFNYLIDAILAVPRTRQMYLRRLRSLMDTFFATGRLEQLVASLYQQVRAEADRDNRKWGNPGSAERGYRSLMEDVLPIRKKQLFETYGPGGPTPLVPESQPGSVALAIGRTAGGNGGFVEIVNPNDLAVDVSGWQLSGGASFTCPPGTVIPARDSLFIASSISGFRQRGASPKGGEGLLVVGPLSGSPGAQSFGQGPSVAAAG